MEDELKEIVASSHRNLTYITSEKEADLNTFKYSLRDFFKNYLTKNNKFNRSNYIAFKKRVIKKFKLINEEDFIIIKIPKISRKQEYLLNEEAMQKIKDYYSISNDEEVEKKKAEGFKDLDDFIIEYDLKPKILSNFRDRVCHICSFKGIAKVYKYKKILIKTKDKREFYRHKKEPVFLLSREAQEFFKNSRYFKKLRSLNEINI